MSFTDKVLEVLRGPRGAELVREVVKPAPKRARTGYDTHTPHSFSVSAEDADAERAWRTGVEKSEVRLDLGFS